MDVFSSFEVDLLIDSRVLKARKSMIRKQ